MLATNFLPNLPVSYNKQKLNMPKAANRSQSRTCMKAAAPYPPVEHVTGSSDGARCITDSPLDVGFICAIDLEETVEKGKVGEVPTDEQLSSTSATQSTTSTKDAYIPRPQNKFMLFRSEMCSRKAPELAQVTRAGEKSRIIARLWKALSAEEKEIWDERSQVVKKEHERQYPDYKFHPKLRKPKTSKQSKQQHTKSASKRLYKKPKSEKRSDNSALFQATATTLPIHHAPHAQALRAPEPILDKTFFQPGAGAFRADWFDFTSFGMRPPFTSEVQTRFGTSPVTDNRIHTPLHLSNEMSVSATSAPVVQFSVFPSMPLYAQTDLYGRVNSGLLVSNNADLGQSVSQAKGLESNSSFGQWPTSERGLSRDVIDSFNSPGSSSSGLSNCSPKRGNEQSTSPSRPYWDFVTPDEPAQVESLTPSWPYIL